MKIIGIIGGFGPQASADFFLAVVNEFRKMKIDHQPKIILRNVPVPKKLEDDLLTRAQGQNKFKSLLVETAQQLEIDRADLVVLPCNTLQIFARDIQRSINIPFIGLRETVQKFLAHKNIQKLGLLATSVTLNNNLFDDVTEQIFLPTKHEQKLLDQGLHQRVTNGNFKLLKTTVNRIIHSMVKREVKHILLASTDLHGEGQNLPPQVVAHDTLDILARETARLSLARCDIVK